MRYNSKLGSSIFCHNIHVLEECQKLIKPSLHELEKKIFQISCSWLPKKDQCKHFPVFAWPYEISFNTMKILSRCVTWLQWSECFVKSEEMGNC